MLEYKRIKKEDKEKLKQLHDEVYESLPRKDFFIPYSDEVLDMMFDNEKIIAYGAYDKGRLVGAAQLYLSEMFVEEVRELLELHGNNLADLCGSIVLSEYRQNGIMTSLSTILVQEAKKRNIEYIIITAHPENIASNTTYVRMGAEKVVTTTFGEYWRNVYLMDLTKKKAYILEKS